DVEHALPGGLGTRAVGRPEADPGDELHHQAEGQGAAPDVAPAGPAGNRFEEGFLPDAAHSGAVVEPVDEILHGKICGQRPRWGMSDLRRGTKNKEQRTITQESSRLSP